MPPQMKITKQNILDKALDIASREGINAINARKLASELSCSVQPIYYQFTSMDELKKELIRYSYKFYESYINKSKIADLKYLATGIAYIKFAKEQSNLFNILFMTPRKETIEDPTINYVYQIIMDKTGLSLEKVKEFHFNMWIYVHGVATMVYTNIIDFNTSKIEKLLINQFNSLIRRYEE